MKMTDGFGRDYPLEHVLDGVGRGWRDLVYELIVDLFDLGWDGELHQIKEKFGGLRFYIGGGSDEVYERVNRAEEDSFKVCEMCGEPGRLRNEKWWLTTRCDKCFEEEK